MGDAREALRLFTELLPDQERVLGRDHPDTLTTRNNIAHWTGEVGDAREALRLFTELLPDQERVLGRDHPDTLTTRNNIAHWTGGVGDAREALRLFTELLPDKERVLGRDHPDTLRTRNNIAHWTGEVGDAREALRLFAELLPDQERVLGRDHPDTLTTRNNIAHWTGEVGDAREALRLSAELLPDRERVLGRDHPDTLTTRNNIAPGPAVWGRARRCGCPPSCCRTGSGCWATTTPTRSRPATTSRTGPAGWVTRVRRCGCSRAAAGLERVLGRDHPDTLRTQETIKLLESAASLSQEGRASRAIWLTDPAVDVLVEAPPMIGRVGPMRRRSVMDDRRGPARSAGRPGPCQGVETGTQLESRTSCVPVSTPSPFPAPTPRHRFFRIAPTVTALRGRRLDS